jgi:hypothetical protein
MPRRKTLTPELKRKSGEWYDLLKNVDAYLRPIPFVATPRPTDNPRGGVALTPQGRLAKWLLSLSLFEFDIAQRIALSGSIAVATEGLARLTGASINPIKPFTKAEVEAYQEALAEADNGSPKRRIVGHYLITPEGRMEWQELLTLLECSPHASIFEGVIEHKQRLHQLDNLWDGYKTNHPSWWGETQKAFVWLAKLWEPKEALE